MRLQRLRGHADTPHPCNVRLTVRHFPGIFRAHSAGPPCTPAVFGSADIRVRECRGTETYGSGFFNDLDIEDEGFPGKGVVGVEAHRLVLDVADHHRELLAAVVDNDEPHA